MSEYANHTAWVDRFGDTWVRVDDVPGACGTWWPLTDGPGWDAWARSGVGTARTWDEAAEYRPFVEADRDRTAQALERVRQEAAR